MGVKITVLLLMLAVCSTLAFIRKDRFQNYLGNKSAECGTKKIVCECGHEKGGERSVTLELEMHRVDVPSTGKSKCDTIEDPYDACIGTKIQRKENGDKVSCSYPKHSLHNRSKRQLKPCFTPALDYAKVNCTKYPWEIKCGIQCYPGNAMRVGGQSILKLDLSCKFKENQWKPERFQDCHAFLNCKAKLVEPGILNCKTPFDAAPHCYIGCYDYEKKEYNKMKKYECINDTYAETLPPCAVIIPKSAPLVSWPNNYVFPTPSGKKTLSNRKFKDRKEQRRKEQIRRNRKFQNPKNRKDKNRKNRKDKNRKVVTGM